VLHAVERRQPVLLQQAAEPVELLLKLEKSKANCVQFGSAATPGEMVYDGHMTRPSSCQFASQHALTASFGAAALALALTACGSSVVKSGAGVGSVAQGLAVHADGAARNAEVCLLKDAVASQAGGVDKSLAETCAKAQKNDLLWRRALQVLSLYGERLSSAASGDDAETSGKLEAALSGINGADWSDAEDQAARDAVVQLVTQMSAPSATAKPDLAKLVQEAAPPVKTLCASLSGHFDGQLKELAAIRKDVDKKSMSRAIRRCGTYETHPICVADTVVDRMVYAEVFARVVAIENGTYDARDGVLRFCAAHDKLAEAAQAGQIGKKETYAAVTDAAKSVTRAQPDWEVAEVVKHAEPGKEAMKPSAAPAKK
jgi:hypothetical protein